MAIVGTKGQKPSLKTRRERERDKSESIPTRDSEIGIKKYRKNT